MFNQKDFSKTPVVSVWWIDSYSSRGWQHVPDQPDTFPIIHTIGYLLAENDEGITVSTSVSPEGRVMDPLSIPKVAITRRKKVTMP